MKVVLRTGGGHGIGLGHLMRSLALAEALVEAGAQCTFAGEVPAFLGARLAAFPVIAVPDGMAAWADVDFSSVVAAADWLVTDLYGIDASWQRESPVPVLAITDPPLRPQAARLTLLPTCFTPMDGALTAPEHILVSRAVTAHRAAPRRGRRLLISCGGGADGGLTRRILDALAADTALSGLQATVVTGLLPEADLAAIAARLGSLPQVQWRQQVSDMPALIAAHDIAVGTPAGAALERACLGLAQILVPVADNQLALGQSLAARGAAVVLEAGSPSDAIAAALAAMLADPAAQQTIAAAGFTLVDGLGPSRVAAALAAQQ